jgi:hypothetical protein
MPAIDLARLKTQTARLSEHFAQPEVFLHDLQEVLEAYTNRTKRVSQVVSRLSLPTYHTPAPVMRQIERELIPLAEAQPLEGVKLVHTLWENGSLETRLLAARLLGMIPPLQAIPAFGHLPEWLGKSTDKEVRRALLVDTFARVRSENPDVFFRLLEEWLKSPRADMQMWGLQALIPLLQDPDFENLPSVFRILRPAARNASPTTQLDLQTCLTALEKVSLTETLLFLREMLEAAPRTDFQRILQRMLPAFSPRMQAGLRESLRARGSRTD